MHTCAETPADRDRHTQVYTQTYIDTGIFVYKHKHTCRHAYICACEKCKEMLLQIPFYKQNFGQIWPNFLL